MSDRTKKRTGNILLSVGAIFLLIFLLGIMYRWPPFLNVCSLAILLATLFVGYSCKRSFSQEFRRKMDFLYYGIAMMGVVFLFGAQQAERIIVSLKLRLVTVEFALEKALAEESKLERMSNSPDYDIEASVEAILQGLYVESDERFDFWCEYAENALRPGPDPKFICSMRYEFDRIRDKHLARFGEIAAASSREAADAIDFRTAALIIPQTFLDVVSEIQAEVSRIGKEVGLPEIDLPRTAQSAISDLELVLSAKVHGRRFRSAWENNQVTLRELASEKRSLKTAEERAAILTEKSFFHTAIQWVVYNIWPYLLLLALSIKLAKTAQD